MVSTKYRSDAPEAMDDFGMEGEILRDALDKIASINQLLGGNKVTLQGVDILLQGISQDRIINIVDIGCGNGDMLRAVADYARSKNRQVKLTGIDANQFTISHAESLSAEYPDISYKCVDIFSAPEEMDCDIALCTLTLHHFKDQEIFGLMSDIVRRSKIGIVINDLHRSKLAYNLFKGVCYVFGLNKMSKDDGLVSILRGFKRADLERYSKHLNLQNYTIRWKWAFRYQWIIKKI